MKTKFVLIGAVAAGLVRLLKRKLLPGPVAVAVAAEPRPTAAAA